MEYIKILKERFSLSSVATLAIGLLLVIYPDFTGKAICWLIAASLITKGAGSILSRYRNKSLPQPVVFELMGGISTIFMGLFVALRSEMLISIIPFVVGLFLLISGVTSLQKAFEMKRMNYAKWNHGLIFTLIKVALALVIVMNPFGTAMTLTRFIGACLVYDGATGLVTVFESVKAKTDYEKAQENLRNMNLTKDEPVTDHIPVVEAEFVDVVQQVVEERE
jgi:hydrogenase/urease accessory protein HupE